MSTEPYDYATRRGVRPISWEDFHGLCKALAMAVANYQPDIILPVGRGGYYPGALLAHLLQVEVYPIRLSRRVRDEVKYKTPRWIVEPPAMVSGRNVLIVDQISSSGETISIVKEKALEMGAAAVRSAVLYAHTWGTEVPDYIGLITDTLVLNPWDREILRSGTFQFHPEYAEALAAQGLAVEAHMLIPATKASLAKG